MNSILKKKKTLYIATIIALLVLVLIGAFVSMTLNNGNETQLFNKRPIIVASDHLEPEVKQYALCWMETMKPEMRSKITKGDIIIYPDYISGTKVTICQKVIKKDGMIIITGANKNAPASQDTIKSTTVQAKIISTWNWTSPIIHGITKPFVFWGLISTCLFIILSTLLIAIIGRRRKNDTK